MSATAFLHGILLSHGAKDKAVVRPTVWAKHPRSICTHCVRRRSSTTLSRWPSLSPSVTIASWPELGSGSLLVTGLS